MRLYYSVQFSKSGDFTYYVAFIGFWSLGEMASGFLVMCLPVSPRFCQSLKQIRIPSRITIPRIFHCRSSNPDGYLSQFNLRLARRFTLIPAVKASPPATSSVSLVSGNLAPADGSSSFTPGNTHILRYVEISSTNEPVDVSKPVFPTHW